MATIEKRLKVSGGTHLPWHIMRNKSTLGYRMRRDLTAEVRKFLITAIVHSLHPMLQLGRPVSVKAIESDGILTFRLSTKLFDASALAADCLLSSLWARDADILESLSWLHLQLPPVLVSVKWMTCALHSRDLYFHRTLGSSLEKGLSLQEHCAPQKPGYAAYLRSPTSPSLSLRFHLRRRCVRQAAQFCYRCGPTPKWEGEFRADHLDSRQSQSATFIT
jgi:hypothetical protein